MEKLEKRRREKVWNRLRVLRFPCFEGDPEIKNNLCKLKLKELQAGWPCSVCKLKNSTECGIGQAVGLEWAIFEPELLSSKVRCMWCGEMSRIERCHISRDTGTVWCPVCGERTGIEISLKWIDKKIQKSLREAKIEFKRWYFEGKCYNYRAGEQRETGFPHSLDHYFFGEEGERRFIYAKGEEVVKKKTIYPYLYEVWVKVYEYFHTHPIFSSDYLCFYVKQSDRDKAKYLINNLLKIFK